MPMKTDGEVLVRAGRQLRALYRTTAHRLYIDPSQEREIISAFERTYVESAVDFTWMGSPMVTSPLDLWIYQEIVHEISPDLIITTSQNCGYLATLCQLRGTGEVLCVGVGQAKPTGEQARLRTVPEPMTSAETRALMEELSRSKRRVLVVVGSSHRRHPVLDELRLYGSLVTRGSYLIVEDTRSGLDRAHGRAEAVEEFLRTDPSFVVDGAKEKFYLSDNQGGYLRRSSPR